MQMERPDMSVECLDQILSLGGRGEIGERDRKRQRRAVVNPVRRHRRNVGPEAGREVVGSQLAGQSLDTPVGTVPVSLDLVAAIPVTVEAAEAEFLRPAHLHQQAVLDVEVSGRHRIR